jgi:triosephosphate isomerase
MMTQLFTVLYLREINMRNYYIAGNWKMNKTPKEAAELAKALVSQLKGCKEKLLIAPAFVAIPAVAEVVKGSNIRLGAQNMAQEESGAFTGEVSVLMLKELGVQTVILGHSERRAIYKEDDALINKKLHLALKHDLEVILCVGETLAEREGGKLETVLKTQITEGFKGVDSSRLKDIVVAYEPVWAIGTGKTASPDDADGAHQLIRKVLAGLYGEAAAKAMMIQYGGSVKADNAAELMAKPNIDGALVGGAALKPETFVPIANFR